MLKAIPFVRNTPISAFLCALHWTVVSDLPFSPNPRIPPRGRSKFGRPPEVHRRERIQGDPTVGVVAHSQAGTVATVERQVAISGKHCATPLRWRRAPPRPCALREPVGHCPTLRDLGFH